VVDHALDGATAYREDPDLEGSAPDRDADSST
jgi:hypothetical protein